MKDFAKLVILNAKKMVLTSLLMMVLINVVLFDAFAGSGAICPKKAKSSYSSGFSEIDKSAINIYKLNHGNIKNYGE